MYGFSIILCIYGWCGSFKAFFGQFSAKSSSCKCAKFSAQLVSARHCNLPVNFWEIWRHVHKPFSGGPVPCNWLHYVQYRIPALFVIASLDLFHPYDSNTTYWHINGSHGVTSICFSVVFSKRHTTLTLHKFWLAANHYRSNCSPSCMVIVDRWVSVIRILRLQYETFL